MLRVRLNNYLLTYHPNVQDLKSSFLPMFASSFSSVIVIFQNTRISQGHSFLHMLALQRRICTTFWAAAPPGPEPGSDISEGKGRLETLRCMLITMNVFCLTLWASSWFIEVRFLWIFKSNLNIFFEAEHSCTVSLHFEQHLYCIEHRWYLSVKWK